MTPRLLMESDISQVLTVQTTCYRPELIESRSAFLRKLTLFPSGCFGSFECGQMVGYVFAHPWVRGTTVPLDSSDYLLPGNIDCMYVHDLAVVATARGKGVAPSLIQALSDAASTQHLKTFALVAVQDSEKYWTRWGFRTQYSLEYGTGVPAHYMTCDELPKWTR